MANTGQTRMDRRKSKKQDKKPIWKKVIATILIVMVLCILGVGALFTYYIATAPKIDAAKLSDPFPSEFYDQDGDLIATLGKEKRSKVNYENLPDTLIDAVTATEDSRYFKHHGIDIRRIGGAIKANITSGFGSEGASTITQQVVENAFLSSDKKLKLKVQEQWLALKLEREYSKEEILEMYLNKINYGSGAYGVAKAAEIYFDKKDLKDLTLAESAILAGLPQRPTAYNPFENPDLTKGRMETVLKLMVRHNKITQKEADEALKVDIESLLTDKKPDTGIQYDAFLQQVDREVKQKLDGANIYTDGLKIYTTLDKNAQDHVDFILKDSEENPINYPDDEMQAGMTVLDTKTGAIRAIGGRRNGEGIHQYNYAIQGQQQPGSTAKPIMSYGPAIENLKWSTHHQLNDDKPYKVQGSTEIRNWNRKYSGWMSMREALLRSLNVPAVKTLDEVGYDKSQKFAEGLGIKFNKNKMSIRDAIGGTETSINPLQLAGAYQAFGNEGIYNEPYSVTKVEYPDGKEVSLKSKPKAAMSDYTAYMVTDMLKDVVNNPNGTGTQAQISGLPVAGKTGTTSLPDKSGSPDAWFAGYTTNYTISVWTGGYTDDDGKRDVIPEGYTKIPLDMFKSTMTEISKNVDTPDFTKPNSVVERTIDGKVELFVKGHEPKEEEKESDDFPAVSGLQAEYDEDDNQIEVDWDHDSDDDASFIVSASVNGGSMKELGTTDDDQFDIKSVRKNASYKIQVVAVNKKDSSQKSEPKSVSVKTGDEDDEVGSISNLSAKYSKDNKNIDVSWDYDGASAKYEVTVSPGNQKQTVSSKGIEIGGAKPGETYTISVTPVTDSGEKGDAASTQVTVPNDEDKEESDDSSNDQDKEDQNNNGDQNQDDQDQNNNEENENNQNNNEEKPDDSSGDPEADQNSNNDQNSDQSDSGDDSGSNEDSNE
ncbi:MAG TPA: PBP1A family penicillin-binding protein [Candidatus Avamphibacillus intestinigallinarum]|nr:PBP1A family penicillin-binding protein [Candidatus Avamphibacillus intestinigallinarum]